MDKKACVSASASVRVSRLTVSHPVLWQPYSSVVRWQLLLDSDVELPKKGKRNSQPARRFELKLKKNAS